MNAANLDWQFVPSAVSCGSSELDSRPNPVVLSMQSDEELIILVAQKNESAFEILVDRYMKSIHNFAFRFCQDSSLAEDLTQETFLRLWQRATTWVPGKVKFTTWLHQITRNLCIDQHRKSVPVIEDESGLQNVASSSGSTGYAELTKQQIQRAIVSLPERQRTAFLFCQVQGWSQADVASVMDTSVEAVEGLLGRARRTLRKELVTYKDRHADDR